MKAVGMVRSLAGELKRRKVWRVAFGYVLVGAGVVGFADAALPGDLWDMIQVPVVAIAVLGFPIALVLAWSYDLTWGGLERTGATAEASTTGPGNGVSGQNDEVEAFARAGDVPQVTLSSGGQGSPVVADRSIVVLPFENISPDPDQDYFCDGMTEEIITDLSRLRSLHVISRTSAMLLKGSGKDVRTIGREVGVRYVLEGSVRRAADRLRVTAQLIDSHNDAHLWAERYDGEVGDIFAIQESVARSIAEALRVELSPEEERALGSVPLQDTYAWEYVLRARHEMWRGTEPSIRTAIAYLEAAAQVVGENVTVLGALGEAWLLLPHVTGQGIEEIGDRLNEIAARIVRLDSASPLGHFTRGLAMLKRRWRFPDGLRELRRAARLDPGNPSILQFLQLGAQMGCTEEALEASDALLGSDPLSPIVLLSRAYVLMLSGLPEEGLPYAERTLELEPQNAYFGLFHMCILAQLGRLEETTRLADSFSALQPDNWTTAVLVYSAALKGMAIDALLTPDFLRTAQFDETFSWILAQCMAQVGRIHEAMDWLENAASLGFINPEFLSEHDVLLGPVRQAPRFTALLAKGRRIRDELLDADPWTGV